jgi:hypothetical protein
MDLLSWVLLSLWFTALGCFLCRKPEITEDYAAALKLPTGDPEDSRSVTLTSIPGHLSKADSTAETPYISTANAVVACPDTRPRCRL